MATENVNGSNQGLHRQHDEEKINVKMSPAEAKNNEDENINNINNNIEKMENITEAQQTLEVPSVNN